MALGLPINDKHSASSSEEIVDLQTYTDLINSERAYLAEVVFPGVSAGTAPASNEVTQPTSPVRLFEALRTALRLRS